MKPSDDEFTNISDEDEEEIHIIESKEPIKPVPKRKKEESVFKHNPMMEHIQVTLIGFQKESFLKIETQTYKIEVKNLSTDEMWIIKRRFSDVMWIYETFSVNHLGYIIPFFPSSTLESFFTAKLGLSFGKDKKDDLITERSELISDFLKAVYSHDDLKYSEEAEIFICRNDNDFMTEKKRMEAHVREYRDLETEDSGFLSIVEKGSSFVSSYLGGSKKLAREITQEDLEFEELESKIIEEQNMLKKLSQSLDEIIVLKIKESEAIQIEGEWEKIESLNSRLEEGRKYNGKVSSQLKDKVLRQVNQLVCWVEQVHAELTHRKKLVEFIYSLKQNIDDISRIKKLERRIEKFQNNFRKSYPYFKSSLGFQQKSLFKGFSEVWEEYKYAMGKIWK